MSGRWTYVPYEAVTLNFVFPPAYRPTFAMSSNGLASGNHRLEATVHALCEVIERDALSLWSLDGRANGRHRPSISPGRPRSVPARSFPARRGRRRPVAWDITSDTGLPAYSCQVVERPERRDGEPSGPPRAWVPPFTRGRADAGADRGRPVSPHAHLRQPRRCVLPLVRGLREPRQPRTRLEAHRSDAWSRVPFGIPRTARHGDVRGRPEYAPRTAAGRRGDERRRRGPDSPGSRHSRREGGRPRSRGARRDHRPPARGARAAALAPEKAQTVSRADVHVFLGPSLRIEEARKILEAEYLPPVKMGDVQALLRERPRVMPSSTAISSGCRPSGTRRSSARCRAGPRRGGFQHGGAPGGGAAFVRDGGRRRHLRGVPRRHLTADDEVALAHGVGGGGYRPLSEALVNIRDGLSLAEARGILSPDRAGGPDRRGEGDLLSGALLVARPPDARGPGIDARPHRSPEALLLAEERPNAKRRDAVAALSTSRPRSIAPHRTHPSTSSRPSSGIASSPRRRGFRR